MFPFQINSPQVRNKLNEDLISIDKITDYIHRQLASSCLINKLQLYNLGEVDCSFRRVVIDVVPNNLQIWLSKSFTNFTNTAHQLFRQGLVTTEVYRMCNVDKEDETARVLHCKYTLFNSIEMKLCQHFNSK